MSVQPSSADTVRYSSTPSRYPPNENALVTKFVMYSPKFPSLMIWVTPQSLVNTASLPQSMYQQSTVSVPPFSVGSSSPSFQV